jgi:hypothetical protein
MRVAANLVGIRETAPSLQASALAESEMAAAGAPPE